MKKALALLLITISTFQSISQVRLNDFGRVVLNSYLPENINLPAEAKSQLLNKLNQITSSNGMGGSQVNPRFIITASVNIGAKDIIAGPPQMIAQNIELTLFIGDAITNTVFSNTTLNIKGVGTNENKAFIEAFNNINPKNNQFKAFLEEGKQKIVDYYAAQCDFILKQAATLSDQFKFEEAIYQLMMVPETCKECYFKSKDAAIVIFNKKIDSDCTEKLKQAKLLWASEPNSNGASKTAAILTSIIPSENCKSEISKLTNEVKKKLQDDEKRKYDFEMLEMQKRYDTEQKRLDAAREIAVEQARNQPTTVTYTNVYWR
jgi:hypothetical protein